MPDEYLPKKILFGELQVGKRSHGGQKTRYKDTLKASLKDFNIPTESSSSLAKGTKSTTFLKHKERSGLCTLGLRRCA